MYLSKNSSSIIVRLRSLLSRRIETAVISRERTSSDRAERKACLQKNRLKRSIQLSQEVSHEERLVKYTCHDQVSDPSPLRPKAGSRCWSLLLVLLLVVNEAFLTENQYAHDWNETLQVLREGKWGEDDVHSIVLVV